MSFESLKGVIPKARIFYQRAEGSPAAHCVVAGDPSLRLHNGCAQDDAIDDERRWHKEFKLNHYRFEKYFDAYLKARRFR